MNDGPMFLKSLVDRFKFWKYRKVARAVLRRYPYFSIGMDEFVSCCLILQRYGAGIVLGRPVPGVEVKIISVAPAVCRQDYENLPLGHFGEIFIQKCHHQQCLRTGLYGFFDQRGRVWCCGPIQQTITYEQQKFFPYCIEPIFKNIPWVRSLSLTMVQGKVMANVQVNNLFRLFPQYVKERLMAFSKKFRITSMIRAFRVY